MPSWRHEHGATSDRFRGSFKGICASIQFFLGLVIVMTVRSTYCICIVHEVSEHSSLRIVFIVTFNRTSSNEFYSNCCRISK